MDFIKMRISVSWGYKLKSELLLLLQNVLRIIVSGFVNSNELPYSRLMKKYPLYILTKDNFIALLGSEEGGYANRRQYIYEYIRLHKKFGLLPVSSCSLLSFQSPCCKVFCDVACKTPLNHVLIYRGLPLFLLPFGIHFFTVIDCLSTSILT